MAVAATVAGMAVAGGAPATAQPAAAQVTSERSAPVLRAASGPTAGDEVCLSNSSSYCTAVDPVEIYIAVISTIPVAKVIWDWINEGKGDGGQEGEEESEGDEGESGGDAGLCLAMDNTHNADVFMTTCGANGTVWIAIPHNDGYYLESRWWYNQGLHEVLTADPVSNNSVLFAGPPENSGSPYWQTWSWYYAP